MHTAGADPCLANLLGETPVMVASRHGFAQLLPRLLAAGGAAAMAMRGGMLLGCPLHFAAEHAPLETVRLLVSTAPEGERGQRVCGLVVGGWAVGQCRWVASMHRRFRPSTVPADYQSATLPAQTQPLSHALPHAAPPLCHSRCSAGRQWPAAGALEGKVWFVGVMIAS